MTRQPETLPALLKALIEIPSPYFKEDAITEYVYRFLENTGINTLRQQVADPLLREYKGENIVGVLDAGREKTILLNAHMDTVYPTADWKRNPFEAYVMGDRMVGLGAADMKGGLAAMLMTAKDLMEQVKVGKPPKYNMVFLASVDEEGPDSMGALSFLKEPLARQVDYAVVMESGQGLTRGEGRFPSIIHSSLGCYLYVITITGQSAHAADPDAGANAIEAMGQVLAAVKQVELEMMKGFSKPVCNPLWIEGGEKALSTPESCRILIDFHITPTEDRKQLKEKIIRQVEALQLPVSVTVDEWRNGRGDAVMYPPYTWGLAHPLTKTLSDSCLRVTGNKADQSPSSICVGDFNHFSYAGIPTMILGPDGDNLHAGGEEVSVKNLESLVKILVDFVNH